MPLTGRRLAVLTILLGGFTAFGPLSMDLYLPAFPELAADFGTGQAAVQLTLTADVSASSWASWCSGRCPTPAAAAGC